MANKSSIKNRFFGYNVTGSFLALVIIVAAVFIGCNQKRQAKTEIKTEVYQPVSDPVFTAGKDTNVVIPTTWNKKVSWNDCQNPEQKHTATLLKKGQDKNLNLTLQGNQLNAAGDTLYRKVPDSTLTTGTPTDNTGNGSVSDGNSNSGSNEGSTSAPMNWNWNWIKYLVYIIVGLLLLAAIIWLLRQLWNLFAGWNRRRNEEGKRSETVSKTDEKGNTIFVVVSNETHCCAATAGQTIDPKASKTRRPRAMNFFGKTTVNVLEKNDEMNFHNDAEVNEIPREEKKVTEPQPEPKKEEEKK